MDFKILLALHFSIKVYSKSLLIQLRWRLCSCISNNLAAFLFKPNKKLRITVVPNTLFCNWTISWYESQVKLDLIPQLINKQKTHWSKQARKQTTDKIHEIIKCSPHLFMPKWWLVLLQFPLNPLAKGLFSILSCVT